MGLWVKRPSRRVVLGGRKAEGRRAGRNRPGPLQFRGRELTVTMSSRFTLSLPVSPSVCGGHNSPSQTTVHHHQPRVRAHARVSVCRRSLPPLAACRLPLALRCAAAAVACPSPLPAAVLCFLVCRVGWCVRLLLLLGLSLLADVASRRACAERGSAELEVKGTSQTGNRYLSGRRVRKIPSCLRAQPACACSTPRFPLRSRRRRLCGCARGVQPQ